MRHPSQAGAFYAGTAQSLKAQIEGCFTHRFGPGKLPRVVEDGLRNVVGLICPHAGYMYSGSVAAHAYYNLAVDGKPDVVVIFGPNHTGRGSALALMSEGVWRTPLGDVEIDTLTAKQIVDESRIVDVDDSAHTFEHSIEVQLPFLQYLYGSAFKFVPICFLMQDLESSREVGRAVAKALSGKNSLIIASTDMTHYEPHEQAQRKDKMAIDAVAKMGEELYYSTVESQNISTCGYGPTVAVITAAKLLGAKRAQLLCYKTSGDMISDFSSVVGYASMSFTK
ncbi:AmmeMemoRadiSam system protein B [Candidatus Bathyarchaeota archaeon]|nr:MAG: AmmeMemoRadiSam system protein B [Candidatus Bathyarchaeota archaeon]